MTQPDAQIICRKTPYGDVCQWEGGRFALMYGDTFELPVKPGMVVSRGRLKLRVINFPYVNTFGSYCDTALVMLESPHAELYWLYRENAERLIRALSNVEMRVWGAWRGLTLRSSPEGELLRVTAWVADKLL